MAEWKPLAVPVYPHRNSMVLIMFQEPLKPRLTDAVHVQKHFFANGMRLIEKAVSWNSFSFPPGYFSRRESLKVCQDY